MSVIAAPHRVNLTRVLRDAIAGFFDLSNRSYRTRISNELQARNADLPECCQRCAHDCANAPTCARLAVENAERSQPLPAGHADPMGAAIARNRMDLILDQAKARRRELGGRQGTTLRAAMNDINDGGPSDPAQFSSSQEA